MFGSDSRGRAERQFFSVHLNLHTFPTDNSTTHGSYAFPFQVQLPNVLPSTDAYPSSKGRELGYRIEYTMTAKLDRVRIDQPFVVMSAPLPNERMPGLVQPMQCTLRFNGLIDKGTLTVGASVSDTHVGRGQTIELCLACRNDSTVRVRHVGIKLIETLIWKNLDTMRSKAERVLYDRLDVEMPGLSKERQLRSAVVDSVKNTDESRRLQRLRYQQIYQDLCTEANKLSIKVPIHARDSFKGQLVCVSHHLEVKFQTGMGFTNPRLRINLKIGTHPNRIAGAISTASSPVNPTEAIPINVRPPPPPLPEDIIPWASATPLIPEDTVQAPLVIAPEDVIVLGGESTRVLDLADLVPLPPPTTEQQRQQQSLEETVSVQILLEEMTFSVNDYTIISNKLRNERWLQFFQNHVTPHDFGNIIAHVNVDSDQPRVASTIAPYLKGSNWQGFTCAYAVAAIRNSADWIRPIMLERLLPLCTDTDTNSHIIRNELNEWEIVLAEHFLQRV